MSITTSRLFPTGCEAVAAIESLEQHEGAVADDDHLVHLGQTVGVGPRGEVDRPAAEAGARRRRRRIDDPQLGAVVARDVGLVADPRWRRRAGSTRCRSSTRARCGSRGADRAAPGCRRPRRFTTKTRSPSTRTTASAWTRARRGRRCVRPRDAHGGEAPGLEVGRDDHGARWAGPGSRGTEEPEPRPAPARRRGGESHPASRAAPQLHTDADTSGAGEHAASRRQRGQGLRDRQPAGAVHRGYRAACGPIGAERHLDRARSVDRAVEIARRVAVSTRDGEPARPRDAARRVPLERARRTDARGEEEQQAERRQRWWQSRRRALLSPSSG